MDLTLNDNFGVRYIDDEIIVFDKSKTDFNELYKFSESSLLIIDELIKKTPLEEIIKKMVERYDVDFETAQTDLEAFVMDLLEYKIFVNHNV